MKISILYLKHLNFVYVCGVFFGWLVVVFSPNNCFIQFSKHLFRDVMYESRAEKGASQ